jgi:autotransporter passenger strand-loop-strand repeat protein
VQSGGTLIFMPGATSTGATAQPGGTIISAGVVVLSGDTATGYVVVSSAVSLISGAVLGTSNTQQLVYAGGTAVDTSATLGAAMFVAGTASDAVVSSGATVSVVAGGTAISTTLGNGGGEYVRGVAIDTVLSGGYQFVSPGGVTSFTTVSAGDQNVGFGGVASDTYVTMSFSEQAVTDGGTTVSTFAISGGEEFVFSGVSSDTTVTDGGTEQLQYANAVSIDTFVAVSGTEYIFSGTASGTVISGVDASDQVRASGITVGTVLSNGGVEYVFSGGTVGDTTVSSGGYEVLSASGTAISTTVELGGAIDVPGLIYVSGGSATVTTSGLLTVSVGSQSYTQQLSGDYAGEYFHLAPDNGVLNPPFGGPTSGTLLTLGNAPCYRRGTRILTERGEVGVEDLCVGDLVRTVVGGGVAPVVWIGQRDVDCARHPKPGQVWPVRVAAGAFGPGRPYSELFLSPDHAVYVGEVLIPIRHLINGSTVVQVPMDRVSYYHIELPRHDVVLAQGLPAESFLDIKDGTNYANRPGPVRLYPDFTARMWEAFGCARLIVGGAELAAARALVARFAADQVAA